VAIDLRKYKIGYVPSQQALAVRRLRHDDAIEATVERLKGSADRLVIYPFARNRPAAVLADSRLRRTR
jgi:1-acyl-sn-glycerol-3-phosphate acyltransferase